MNKKIIIAMLSVLAVIFLTAQTCTTGLAAECTSVGDILCDDTEAYECGYSGYGYYVSRASEYDIEYCGATDTTTDTDEDGLTDYDEVNTYGTDPYDRDTDGDGALDGEEVVADYDALDATDTPSSMTGLPTHSSSSLSSDGDSDGLTDLEEITYGTDPDDADSDDDHLSDSVEVGAGTDPNLADTDGDGYDDGFEVRAGSDPLNATDVPGARDRDADGMPDFFEIAFGFDPLDATDASEDYDGDGLSNYEEYLYETDPTTGDTDGDTYSDYDEINVYETNPRNAADYPVVMSAIPRVTEFRTFPMFATTDTDGDGLTDSQEANLGTDETNTDTDGDGLSDYDEAVTYSTDPLDDDTDGDGLPDGWEVTYSFNPNHTGTDSGDYDSDGLTNLEEYEAGTDPTVAGLEVDCGVTTAEVYVGIDATFDGSASNGDIDFYEWDWDDGTADTSMLEVGAVEVETHEYRSEGVYLPALTITDTNGNTDVCNLILTVKETDEEIEDLQLFKLEDMTHYTSSATADAIFPITAITEESSRERDSRAIKNTKLVNSYDAGKDAGYYLDFYSGSSDPRDVIFTDASYLKPSSWLIVQVEGKINAVSFGDRHAYMLTKTTDTCGKPLYAILTYDSKYVFSIMIEGTEYTLSSDSEVTSAWQEVRGVYTGDEVQLYIDGVLEESESVSGEISSSATAGSLVLGYDTACDNYQYHGYIDNIYIYGE
ncbi:hypothetical protein HZC31_00475 [Candidatus Woesearchaeota archaeon]|nr:hypothetical protein [Candidatus Woesearchaeota archaeon]